MFNWLEAFLGWFTGKKAEQPTEQKQIVPEKPPVPKEPPPPIRKGSLEDIRDFCKEVRKTLKIYKKFYEQIGPEDFLLLKQTLNRLYVEAGNLSDKIDRLIVSQK